MTGQVQHDVAPRGAGIDGAIQRAQIRVGQHPPAIVTQTNTRIAEIDTRIGGDRIDVGTHRMAMPHSHVRHGEQLAGIQRRHFRLHSRTRCQRTARVARTVDRLREDRIGAVLARLDHDVIDLPCRNSELVHAHGLDVLPIGRDHAEFETWNTHVEEAHR